MPEPHQEPKFNPATLYAVTGINAVTFRSWKQRGLMAPLDIHVTGDRSKYSAFQIVLLGMAQKLIEGGFPPRDAMILCETAAWTVKGMMQRPIDKWAGWILVPRGTERAAQSIFSVVHAEEFHKLAGVVGELSIILDIGQIARRVVAAIQDEGGDA